MKKITVLHYDAFSDKPDKGNPAGVVLNGDDLTDEEMQEIAYKVGFNETAFAVKSEVADLRIRYFTPGHEMNLCGHGTMAMIYALKTKGLLNEKNSIIIETRAGNLPINMSMSSNNEMQITMKQAQPQFVEFNGSKEALANSIGLQIGDLHEDFPILYGSTGIWTLLVPIKNVAAFKEMEPKNEIFPSILKEMPKASIHPFCLETYDPNTQMHARHFSSPFSGTIEDAVTGTASGVMGAYYAKYIKPNFEKSITLIVEQGHEIEKDGRVIVTVAKSENNYDIEITGTAVFVKEIDIQF
ncbi:PhzF family phenazine biosynthesis isomerase [Bacillus sp. Bva_UNVM-123]|uniref:PhzF family phenazine biosynthesis isomerase n=1 Tax=Bacillus sp. Bva_UNVM-123 TaxID=2829798 RepID=UPI00391F8CCD